MDKGRQRERGKEQRLEIIKRQHLKIILTILAKIYEKVRVLIIRENTLEINKASNTCSCHAVRYLKFYLEILIIKLHRSMYMYIHVWIKMRLQTYT